MSYATQFNNCMAIFTAFPGQSAILGFTYRDDLTAEVYLLNKKYPGPIQVPRTVYHNGATYTVTSIASSSFTYADFSSFTMPDTILTVNDYIFRQCDNLREITFGANVQTIGWYVTDTGCSNITLNYNSTNAFIGFASTVFRKGIVKVNIGNNVRVIPNGLLMNTEITSIYIPASVRVIGNYAFSGCEKLSNVTIEEGLETIGYYAFEECASLTRVTIPSTIKEISDQGVFRKCTALTEIVINKPAGSIEGAPWGAPNATVIWAG